MRFQRRLKSNISFNASLRKDEPNPRIVAAAYYVAPLPPACPTVTTGVETHSCSCDGGGGGGGGGGVGTSGLWSMTETEEGDVRLLSVKFRDQTVHVYSAGD